MKVNFLENVKIATAISPITSDGTNFNGEIIDRVGYESAALILNWADPTEAVPAELDIILYESSDGAFGTSDVYLALDDALDISAAGEAVYMIRLNSAKRYLRLNGTVTFTGGTTPASPISASICLGDKYTEPVTTAVLGA